MSGVTVTVVAGGYRERPESLTAMTWRAKSARALRFRTCGRLYSCETILQRLAQDLEDMPPELRQFIQEEHAVVCQRHLARYGDLAPPRSARHRRWCGVGRDMGAWGRPRSARR